VLAGKLEAGREKCAPVAGKSTLNRLELSKLEPMGRFLPLALSGDVRGLLIAVRARSKR
jgi:hypothetical protein